jgi:hypothetical protein
MAGEPLDGNSKSSGGFLNLTSYALAVILIAPFRMCNRTGEFTRGMLVVDRRDDVGAYAPGDNRSHVQQELDRLHVSHGPV